MKKSVSGAGDLPPAPLDYAVSYSQGLNCAVWPAAERIG
jgi:hypothetical protein